MHPFIGVGARRHAVFPRDAKSMREEWIGWQRSVLSHAGAPIFAQISHNFRKKVLDFPPNLRCFAVVRGSSRAFGPQLLFRCRRLLQIFARSGRSSTVLHPPHPVVKKLL